MGQYYSPLLIDKNGNKTAFSLQSIKFRKTNDFHEYNGAKLTEHSWMKNPFCLFVMNRILGNPHKIAWIGDYADEEELASPSDYDLCYGVEHKRIDYDEEEILVKDFSDYFVVNHTTKEYFSLCDVIDNDGWKIFPISLLTAIGNGRGGGDYLSRCPDFSLCGTWAYNVISIEKSVPDIISVYGSDYNEIFCPRFVET